MQSIGGIFELVIAAGFLANLFSLFLLVSGIGQMLKSVAPGISE